MKVQEFWNKVSTFFSDVAKGGNAFTQPGATVGGAAGVYALNRLAERGSLPELLGEGFARGGVVGQAAHDTIANPSLSILNLAQGEMFTSGFGGGVDGARAQARALEDGYAGRAPGYTFTGDIHVTDEREFFREVAWQARKAGAGV